MEAIPRKIGGIPVTLFSDERRLAICHDPEETGGYFLFGCDENWNSETDSWHETLEAAERQVESEYPGTILKSPNGQ